MLWLTTLFVTINQISKINDVSTCADHLSTKTNAGMAKCLLNLETGLLCDVIKLKRITIKQAITPTQGITCMQTFSTHVSTYRFRANRTSVRANTRRATMWFCMVRKIECFNVFYLQKSLFHIFKGDNRCSEFSFHENPRICRCAMLDREKWNTHKIS